MPENTPDKRGRTPYNKMPVDLTEVIQGKTVQALVEQRNNRQKERSPLDEWICTVDFRVRTTTLITNYLAQKTRKAKSELTPQDFANVFSDENGNFDASELLSQKGIGEATRRDFFDDLTYTSNSTVVPPLIMRSEGVYVWNPDCLAKIYF